MKDNSAAKHWVPFEKQELRLNSSKHEVLWASNVIFTIKASEELVVSLRGIKAHWYEVQIHTHTLKVHAEEGQLVAFSCLLMWGKQWMKSHPQLWKDPSNGSTCERTVRDPSTCVPSRKIISEKLTVSLSRTSPKLTKGTQLTAAIGGCLGNAVLLSSVTPHLQLNRIWHDCILWF